MHPAPLQSPQPVGHGVFPHMPALQVGVPPGSGQTWPQLPQFVTSELTWASHPFAALPSQFW
jgi:hypothetical protein